MKSDNKIIKLLVNLDFIITSIALAALILLTFFGVFFRYVLNAPIHWQEEMQLMLFVWVIFLGGSVAVRTGSHVAIDIVVDLFPKPVRKIVETGVVILTVCVLCYLMSKSTVLLNQLAKTERSTNMLHIPFSLIYAVVPTGCVLMIVNFVYYAYRRLFLNINEEGEAIND